MKKIINIFSILAVLSLIIFSTRTYAASLDSIDINTSKTIVRPGEEVEVTINFGEDLGAYTFDIAYDDNLFEYASISFTIFSFSIVINLALLPSPSVVLKSHNHSTYFSASSMFSGDKYILSPINFL